MTAATAAQKFDATSGVDGRLMGYELPSGYARARDFPETYYGALESIWTQGQTRGSQSVYNQATQGITPDESLAAALTTRVWIGGICGWPPVATALYASMIIL